MKKPQMILRNYIVCCLAVMASYLLFICFVLPPMQRYAHVKVLASEKVKQMHFTDEGDKDTFLAIWQADTNMDRMLFTLVRCQFAASLFFLSLNCAVLYYIYRQMRGQHQHREIAREKAEDHNTWMEQGHVS